MGRHAGHRDLGQGSRRLGATRGAIAIATTHAQPLRFEFLFERLRDADIHVGPTEIRRLHAVLAAAPRRDDKLENLVAAVFAKSPEQMERARRFARTWIEEESERLGILASSGEETEPVALPLQRPDTTTPSASDTRARRSRRRLGWCVLAVGAIVAAVILVIALREEDSRPDPTPAKISGSTESELPQNSPDVVLPQDALGRPLQIEPTRIMTTWVVDEARTQVIAPTSPRPRPSFSWWPILAALLSFSAAYFLWHDHRRRLGFLEGKNSPFSGPDVATYSPGTVDPRDLLSGREEATLVHGVERFVADDFTPALDLRKTVDDTARHAGMLRVHHRRAVRDKEVWLWRDTRVGGDETRVLMDRIAIALDRSNLSVHRAEFSGSPDPVRRQPTNDAVSPFALESHRGRSIVLIVTDGADFVAAERSALRAPPTRRLLRHLADWPRLAFVDPSGGRHRLDLVLRPYGIRCLAPEDVWAYLGHGSARLSDWRAEPPPLTGERRAWAAAMSLPGRAVSRARAFELGRAMGLSLEPWALKDIVGWSGGDDVAITFSRSRRGELLHHLLDAKAWLNRSLDYWEHRVRRAREKHEDDARSPGDGRGSGAAARFELEEALLRLWRQPAAAVATLKRLHERGLKSEVEAELRPYVPRHEERRRHDEIMLPWRFESLSEEDRLALVSMGFGGDRFGRPAISTGRIFVASLLAAFALVTAISAIPRGATEESTSPSSDRPRIVASESMPESVVAAWPQRFTRGDDGLWSLRIGPRGLPPTTVARLASGTTVQIHATEEEFPSSIEREGGVLWRHGFSPRVFLHDVWNDVQSDEAGHPRRLFALGPTTDTKDPWRRALAIRLLDRCVADAVLLSDDVERLGGPPAWAEEAYFVGDSAHAVSSDWRRFDSDDWQRLANAFQHGEAERFRDRFEPTPVSKLDGWDTARRFAEDPVFSIVPDLELVDIPEGKFRMGSENGARDEKPIRDIFVPTFRMMRFEVTARLFSAVMARDPSSEGRVPGGHNWFDACRFSNALSRHLGRKPAYGEIPPAKEPERPEEPEPPEVVWREGAVGIRLPTEIEWEKACRAGTPAEWKYSFDDAEKLAEYAWFDKNSTSSVHRVGLLKPNPLGLHDIHGNVWEWCWDWWDAKYPEDAEKAPRGVLTGEDRVLRGGSYWVTAVRCRSAFRVRFWPRRRFVNFGFRVVLPPAR